MQLHLAIASVSSKNIKVTSTRIFLDDPCMNIAINLSLLSIAIKVFHNVTMDSRINADGYFRPPRSVNCKSLNSGCESSSKIVFVNGQKINTNMTWLSFFHIFMYCITSNKR